MTQIPLPLPVPVRFGEDDFLVSQANSVAYETLRAWPAWPDAGLILVGPPGSGKSHLAHIWAARAHARWLGAADLAGDPSGKLDRPAVLDDADAAAVDEASLFHLLNIAREARTSLLLTARRSPDRWSLKTADLLSRLRLAPAVEIGTPDDALIRAVLIKLFDDRQVRVEANLIDYLVLRLDRSLAAVAEVVAALDEAGLSGGRRITRALAAETLAGLGVGTD